VKTPWARQVLGLGEINGGTGESSSAAGT